MAWRNIRQWWACVMNAEGRPKMRLTEDILKVETLLLLLY